MILDNIVKDELLVLSPNGRLPRRVVLAKKKRDTRGSFAEYNIEYDDVRMPLSDLISKYNHRLQKEPIRLAGRVQIHTRMAYDLAKLGYKPTHDYERNGKEDYKRLVYVLAN